MLRYWILHRIPPSAKVETSSLWRTRKGEINQVKCITLAQATRSAQTPSTCKIMVDATRKRSCTLLGIGNIESFYRIDMPLLPINNTKETGTMSTGPTRRSLFPYSEKGPSETCPNNGIIYTQNVQGLTIKDKTLDSLVDPIVNLMITCNIMVYCIQETWVFGTVSELVQGHMVFRHNR